MKTPDLQETAALAPLPRYAPSDRDWPEDAAHENGQYQCQCVTCKEYFIGNKRRQLCKKCADEAAAWWASLTPEQHAIETAKKEEEIHEWFALHNTKARQPEWSAEK